MIKNICTYFFLSASLIFYSSNTRAHAQDEPIITETSIIEEIDDTELGYDHLDYLADHQPEKPKKSSLIETYTKELFARMPSWSKKIIFLAIVTLAEANGYISNKWQNLKKSLPF